MGQIKFTVVFGTKTKDYEVDDGMRMNNFKNRKVIIDFGIQNGYFSHNESFLTLRNSFESNGIVNGSIVTLHEGKSPITNQAKPKDFELRRELIDIFVQTETEVLSFTGRNKTETPGNLFSKNQQKFIAQHGFMMKGQNVLHSKKSFEQQGVRDQDTLQFVKTPSIMQKSGRKLFSNDKFSIDGKELILLNVQDSHFAFGDSYILYMVINLKQLKKMSKSPHIEWFSAIEWIGTAKKHNMKKRFEEHCAKRGFSSDTHYMIKIFEFNNKNLEKRFKSVRSAVIGYELLCDTFSHYCSMATTPTSWKPGDGSPEYNFDCFQVVNNKKDIDHLLSSIEQALANFIQSKFQKRAFLDDDDFSTSSAPKRSEMSNEDNNAPAISMDFSGKILWAKHSKMQQANLRTIDANTLAEAQDGERLAIAVKDMGSCKIYPQTLSHSSNGRYVVACGDGEYIVYTATTLRNKAFGSGLEFVWAKDPSIYAVRESASSIKIHKNFKKTHAIRLDIVVDGIDGGVLLAVRSAGSLCFYDWKTAQMVRRIEISAKHVFWSENGKLVTIAGEESFYVLKYNPATFENANPEDITEDGIEDAFEIVGEQAENVKTAAWVGDCFIFTTSLNCLSYFVGGKIVTIAHLDRPIYLLGYMENRIYACDKDHNIVSYVVLV